MTLARLHLVVTAVSNHALRDFEDSELVRRVLRKPFDINEFIDEVLACATDNDRNERQRQMDN